MTACPENLEMFREFNICHRNVRKLTRSQGNIREVSGKMMV